MEFIRDFRKISKKDVALAGGKGASLGEMTQAGISVPPGFVILSNAFEYFIEKTGIYTDIDATLHSVNNEEMHTVESASEKIQSLILNAEMPKQIEKDILNSFKSLDSKYVAVRSSATSEDSADAAWAGQLDTFLNTTSSDLLEKVKHCWASLFTPRAIFYRFEKNLHEKKISVAVVVQKMINSEQSGIAFSVHPVTQDYNQLIIEAGFGLGEAIVSGQITPDSYVIEKSPRKIIEITVSEQTKALYRKESGGNQWLDLGEKGSEQVLQGKEILDLSELVIKIENHYGFPCDIEWAREKGKFYITQSRPITTLTAKQEPKDSQEEIKKKQIIEELKTTEYQKDFEAPISILHFTLAPEAFFSKVREVFGKSFSSVYIRNNSGLMSEYLPSESYEEIGIHLAKLAQNKEKLKSWIIEFKKSADVMRKAISVSPKEYLSNLDSIAEKFLNYTVYQVATKTASNFLPPKTSKIIFNTFEDGRKYSEDLYHSSELKVREVVKYLNKKLPDYTPEQIRSMTLEELKRYINSNSLPSKEELQSRFEDSGILFLSSRVNFIGASEAKEVEEFWTSQRFKDNVLTGKPAFPGKVKGKARVIVDYRKSNLKEGEILVTGMTDPRFLHLMKKSAAIITDAGGMLSHAAIVSRELKTPCIIGTKIATKVLKDGDLIEVDADKGIVRIISNNEGKEEYIFMWGLQPIMPSNWGCALALKNRSDVFPIKRQIQYFDGEVISSYMLKSDLDETKNKQSNQFLKRDYYEDYIKKFKEESKNWWNWIREIEKKNYSELSNQKLIKDHKEFNQYQADSLSYFGSTRPEFTFAVEQRLEEIIKRKFGEKWPNFFGIATTPLELDGVQKEQLDFVKLINSKPDDKTLLAHISKYPWLVFGQFDESKAIEFLEELSKQHKNEDYGEKLKELKEEKEKTKREQEEIFNKLGKEKEEVTYLSNFLQEQAVRRMDIKAYWAGSYFLARKMFNEIAKKININLRDILSYIPEPEVSDLLSGDYNKDINKTLAKRKEAYALVCSQQKGIEFIEGEEAKKLFNQKIKPISKDAEIKGQTAALGRYTGKVRKVMPGDLEMLRQSIKDFKQGEVLVTTMTQPNMMVIAKKAGAIIADEGGITSHAAIISRELKIPCIVGCLHSMQILKDGMEVEVDANKGIVKILEKKK